MRARQTAEIIASQTKSRVKIDKNASEVGWGEWTGRPITEVIASWRGLSSNEIIDFRPPGGESWRDIALRMSGLIDYWQKVSNEQLVIVSHGAPIRFAICGLLFPDLPHRWHKLPSQYDTGSVSAVELTNGKWQIKFTNRTV